MPFETLLTDDVTLRELSKDDADALADAYVRNREHLAPWEPERPAEFYTADWHRERLWTQVLENSTGRALYTVLESDGQIVGRLNLTDVVHGAFENGHLGYWLDAGFTGRGLMTRAVGALVVHARDVLAQAGFERIGFAPSYLRIAGEWQDHVVFQLILHD